MGSTTLFVLSSLLLVSWQQSYAQLGARVEEPKEASIPTSKGRIAGKIVAVGKYQKPKPLPVFKNRSFCGPSVANETLFIGKDGALRNAVITLHSLERAVPVEPGRLILDNKNCAFTPHVQVAVVGSEVLLKNSDPILHTVHARLGSETLFNVGLPKWRQVIKRLDRSGVVRINCDVLHTWMSAAIVVTDTPYFAVSDVNGKFVIEQLPKGQYQADIWHEKLGLKTMGLSVTADHSLALDVVYALSQNSR